MTAKNKEILVANDNGYAAHKLAWFDENGVICTGKVETAIAMGHCLTSTTGERVNAYSVGDTKYTCTNDSTQLVNLRHADYPLSPENRVIFTHALHRFGLVGNPIRASVTLPFRDYYNENGTINADLVKRVAANFSQNNVVSDSAGGQVLDVKGVQVTPEAISAWFDWAMNDDGSMNAKFAEMSDCDGSVLIIDIGGSTTDIVSVSMVDDELIIRNEKSSSEKLGVLDAMEALHASVKDRLGMSGHEGKLTHKVQMQILKNGTHRMGGVQHDFTAERDAACANTSQEIINFIREQAGSTVEYFAIVFVGGGSVVFRKWMEEMMPNAEFIDEYANARGALKFSFGKQS